MSLVFQSIKDIAYQARKKSKVAPMTRLAEYASTGKGIWPNDESRSYQKLDWVPAMY
jgi:hypothetical protein